MKWIAFPDDRFVVSGLYWFEECSPNIWRLPARMKERVRKEVWNLARQPSGGRIRFSSDTSQLRIKLKYAEAVASGNMSLIARAGCDIYVNAKYWNCVAPAEPGQMEGLCFEKALRAMREITIYMPLFTEVSILEIGIDGDARIEPPRPFAVDEPAVFYGTSIVHGGASARAGLTYPAILCRMLNLDFVNLGFSGNGKCEPEMAEALAEIDASLFVIDAGRNHQDREDFEPAYQPFIEIIRDRHPDTPIICVTPFYVTGIDWYEGFREQNEGLRDVVRRAVENLKKSGDKNVRLVKGEELLGPDDADGLTDSVHPNSIGFVRVAERLAPVVKKILAV